MDVYAPKKSRRREKKRLVGRLKQEAQYWCRVWESDGFDIDHLKGTGPSIGDGLRVFKCEPKDYPLVVTLYAKIGLHWYNLQQGTNLQLDHIEKYNRSFKYMPSSYFITLVAKNPATGLLLKFQTCLHENKCNSLDLRYDIARLKPTETMRTLFWDASAPEFRNVSVPEWPSKIDAFEDTDRYYMVQESEWEENGWIRLYLDLAFVTTNRFTRNLKLSDLKIVKVAVETKENVEPPTERLKVAGNATFYIMYEQNLGEGLVLKRRAIVRRTVDLGSGRLGLIGNNLDALVS